MLRAHLVAGLILLALSGCGNTPPPPSNPEICVNATSFACWAGSCSGTFIGTSPEGSVQIKNGGQQPLNITAVSLSGDVSSCPNLTTPSDGFCAGFSFGGDAGIQPPFTIPGQQQAFLGLIFNPTQAKMYSGSVSITSNSSPTDSFCQSSPTQIMITGTGVFPPPVVDSIMPSSGPSAGGTAVVLNGNYFRPGVTVSFASPLGDAGALNVVLDGGSQIFATTPPQPGGTVVLGDGGHLEFVDVIVTNSDGQNSTLASGFSYVEPVDGG